MMLERERAAQTAYMQRYANLQSYKAGGANGGVFGDRDPDGPRTVQGRREAVRYMPEQTVEAISRGLSKPESEVLDSQLLTETAQRGLTDAQAAKATAEGGKLAAEAANIPEQLQFDRDKFYKNYAIDLRKQTAAEQAQEFEQENYVKPGIYGDEFGGKYSVGGATPIFDPREVAGGRGYLDTSGGFTPYAPPPAPTKLTPGRFGEHGFEPGDRFQLPNGEIISADEKFDEAAHNAALKALGGTNYTQKDYLAEFNRQRRLAYGANPQLKDSDQELVE
jgi:hypothetical protein